MAFGDSAFWDTLDLGLWYPQHTYAIDAVVYLIFFTGLARFAIARTYAGRGGMAMSAAVGISLTVGAVSLARTSSFSLSSLGPYAWGLFLLVLGVAGYRVLRELRVGRWPSIAVVVLGLVTLTGAAGDSVTSLLVTAGLAWLLPVLLIAALLGIVFGVASLGHRANPSWSHNSRGVPNGMAPTGDYARMLGQLVEVLRAEGCGPQAQSLLLRLHSAQRQLTAQLEQVTTRLTELGWSKSQSGRRLDPAVDRLIRTAQTNDSEFAEVFKALASAMGSNDSAGALRHTEYLLRMEHDATGIARDLLHVLHRLERTTVAADPR